MINETPTSTPNNLSTVDYRNENVGSAGSKKATKYQRL